RDAHPPGYYVVLKLWTRTWGNSAIALRSLSILAGVGTVVAAIWLGRVAAHAAGRCGWGGASAGARAEGAGLLAGLLAATSTLQIEMSLEARPYTLGTLFALISAGLLLRAIEQPARYSRWVSYAAAALVLSWLHYYAALTVAAQLLYAIGVLVHSWRTTGWSGRTRQICYGLVGAVWLIQLPWAWWWPTFAFQRARSTEQLWMDPLNVQSFCETCWRVLSGGKTATPGGVWAATATVLWLLLSLGLPIRKCPVAKLLGLGAVFPLLFVIGYGLTVRNIIGVRYLTFAHVYLLVGCAVWLYGVRSRLARVLLSLAIVGWQVHWTSQYLQNRRVIASYSGIPQAMQVINSRRLAEDLVVASSPFLITTIRPYLERSEGVYARFVGDHTANINYGPPLRREDYEGLDALLQPAVRRLWFVDSIGLWGQYHTMPVPAGYHVVTEERFAERSGQRQDVLVRELAPLASVEVSPASPD
ncbi:MAG: hypothetical protein KDA75_12475, partial [Planctomycetaceae bacterium]|nr:hypothetical protein [Planctomycetaceae bacterium]